MPTRFIPTRIVSTIHSDLLQRYGGRPGVREPNPLDSALAQPKMTAGGRFIHKTLFDKASAYGFHLCKNHPFVDGNKRVAFVLMDIFLQKNGWEIVASEEDAYSMMMSLASGKLTKVQLSRRLKDHSSKLSRQTPIFGRHRHRYCSRNSLTPFIISFTSSNLYPPILA
jgi:death-on-curing protein